VVRDRSENSAFRVITSAVNTIFCSVTRLLVVLQGDGPIARDDGFTINVRQEFPGFFHRSNFERHHHRFGVPVKDQLLPHRVPGRVQKGHPTGRPK